MNAEYNNPFITGQAVRGNDFFGRKKILSDISDFLNQDNSQVNYFVFGQRRSGKTSLLKTVQDKFKNENLLLLYFNLQDKAEIQLENILSQIKNRIVKYIDAGENIVNIVDFNQFITQINIISDRKIVLLFDEFDVMCKHTYRKKDEGKLQTSLAPFLSNLTDLIEEKNISLKFIIATGRNFNHKYKNLCTDFEKKGKSVTLEGFDYDTVKEIVSLSKEIVFKEEAADKINEISGGNPYIIQAMCHSLYDFAARHNAKSVTKKMVKKRLKSIVKSFGNGLDSIWADIPTPEKIVLYFSAFILENDNKCNKKTIQKEINESNVDFDINLLPEILINLSQNKFLRKKKLENYTFKIEFFRKWIIEEIKLNELNK